MEQDAFFFTAWLIVYENGQLPQTEHTQGRQDPPPPMGEGYCGPAGEVRPSEEYVEAWIERDSQRPRGKVCQPRLRLKTRGRTK